MTTTLEVGNAVKLYKYPPNRSLTDWDRVLAIRQVGYIVELFEEKGITLYLVWFTAKHKRDTGWEVWLAREHFKPVYEKEYAHD